MRALARKLQLLTGHDAQPLEDAAKHYSVGEEEAKRSHGDAPASSKGRWAGIHARMTGFPGPRRARRGLPEGQK